MALENAQPGGAPAAGSALENRERDPPAGPGRPAIAVPEPYAGVLAAYTAALAKAPVSDQTRRTYASKVRQYLAWIADADLDGDPLADRAARDWAVRDYRAYLQGVAKRAPRTVNNALAAIDDFYTRTGLGPAVAARAALPQTAPRALSHRAALRFLREAERRPSPRDTALALVPFYAGARIAETVGLDLDDVALSARKGELRILGKGERVRRVPVHPPLRKALAGWLDERPDWPGAEDNPALFLNQQGGRLSAGGAHTVITTIAAAAGIDEKTTAHVLRHTFATSLVRGGTDLVTVAELLGHARLETVRIYTKPTEEDKVKALDHLIIDE